MGTFSSTLDTAAFIELGGDDSGTGAVFVDGTNVPDRPDGTSGITTITFLDLDGSVAGTAPVRQGGFFKAVLDADVVRWSVDGGTTIGGVLLSDEFRASLSGLVDTVNSATATANTASAQALQAVSDAQQATQDANAAAQTAQTAAQQAQQASAATGFFVKTANAAGTYPARGRTDGVCKWRGKVKPPVTTGYAQAGDEYTRTP